MQRIIIICEGETEQEFCKKILYPHFLPLNILIEYPTIKKSGGGIVPWDALQKQIHTHLSKDPNALVTTLIDYYGLHKKHDFPEWDASRKIVDINERMTFLEQAMKENIDNSVRFRFLPYIQLHEFEGLLFNNIEDFKNTFTAAEFTNLNELTKTILDHPNPELINDGKQTAPSKRLEKLIVGYNKIVYGSLLAEKIGLKNIRNKSPRFNEWLLKMGG